MGLRGPAPAPTALKIVRGNPGKRPLNKDDASRKALTVDEIKKRVPEHFGADVKGWWNYYAEMFAPVRIVTTTDLPMFDQLARATSERIDFEQQMQKAGPLYKSPKTGYIVISPMYNLVSSARDREYKLLREFGGSPASRASIPAVGGEGDKKSPWADL